MAGQSLGHAGLRDKLPVHGQVDFNVPRALPCIAAFAPLRGAWQRRSRHICTVISGSVAPELTLPKQNTPAVYQEEDRNIDDAALNDSNNASSSEDNVICTFRWPAALSGQDVSVVGASFVILHSSSAKFSSNLLVSTQHGCSFLAIPEDSLTCVGSFTDWQNPIALRRSSESNDFIRTVALQPGTYQVGTKPLTATIFACMACFLAGPRRYE